MQASNSCCRKSVIFSEEGRISRRMSVHSISHRERDNLRISWQRRLAASCDYQEMGNRAHSGTAKLSQGHARRNGEGQKDSRNGSDSSRCVDWINLASF
jgi:hypothetical protein